MLRSDSAEKRFQCVDKPIVACPMVRGSWDPKSAALIELDALYEYAAATGDMPEVQRIGEEIARLIDQL